MPIYEFKCTACDHQFERMMKMSDPSPSCPALNGVPNANHGEWRQFWEDAQRNLAAGRKTWYFGTAKPIDIGPEYELSFIPVETSEEGSYELGKTVTKPLSEWLEDAVPCGGETKKLISRSDFHLKGGGWYKDGY